jgi:hypothetical protein
MILELFKNDESREFKCLKSVEKVRTDMTNYIDLLSF